MKMAEINNTNVLNSTNTVGYYVYNASQWTTNSSINSTNDTLAKLNGNEIGPDGKVVGPNGKPVTPWSEKESSVPPIFS